MRKQHTAVLGLALTLALGLVAGLNAMMVESSPSELTAQTDVTVTGTVTGVASRWDDSRSTIFTDVTIAVEQGTTDRQVTVRVPGGEVGDMGLAVEHVPAFRSGQRVTLRLSRTAEPMVFELVAGGQGSVIDGKPAPAMYSYSGYHRDPASIYYRIYTGLPTDWSAAIQAGAGTWSTAGSAFRAYFDGTTGINAVALDQVNVVGRGLLGSGILAQNSFWYNRSTKHVAENDIIFSTRYNWTTTGTPGCYDVQNIGTHEQGHWLVLNDLYKSAHSELTMYGYGATDETRKRTLEPGDIDGIKAIYGAGFDRNAPGSGASPEAVTN